HRTLPSFPTRRSSDLDALAVLHEEAEFQLVLCDLMMPTMSGPELYAALELERPEMLPRIVFMTGCAFTPNSRAFLSTVSNTVIRSEEHTSELQSRSDL